MNIKRNAAQEGERIPVRDRGAWMYAAHTGQLDIRMGINPLNEGLGHGEG